MATVYTVPATRDDTLYTVTQADDGRMSCTCADYDQSCKHIRRIETVLAAQRARAQIAALERRRAIGRRW